ncbi:MAG TPA: NADP-specific glutamate dehydrogenase [Limnobacter sp.]|nr:NADP-specific glutamate dehydrogenase [Limnobacter sp.]
MSNNPALDEFMQGLIRRNPGEPEFHQAVHEVAQHILPFTQKHPKYEAAQILQRLTEPDRIVSFRVCWEDDQGHVRTQRGYRVQHSNAIGPYKGGIRFHDNVTQSILKFLAFEQTFKNSLTGLPMGGGKGGSDFNPKGKSEREIMRFCQAFMTELCRHIGPFTDVPAGDIGVGGREVSYMFGQYKRIRNEFTGVLTGKGLAFGGSEIRVEATGYGVVYFMEDMLAHKGMKIEGRVCSVSGSGNVAQYAVEKILALGGKVITMSDSSGTLHDSDGITMEKLEHIKELKEVKRARISEYLEKYPRAEFIANKRPWHIPCELAFPCATQNEINAEEAGMLVQNGCMGVSEGANMPSEKGAIDVFQAARILFAPSKAANAGGVAVSGLEMTQNSMRLSWSRDELNQRLRAIMADIHKKCVHYGAEEDGHIDYLKGANVAGFVKVADAMLAYGVI